MLAPTDYPIITTVSVGLGVAFVAGLLAKKIGLAPICGYLLAGILIGPFTPGYVADHKVAEELAEIGVVLLMFGVGLHFSFSDLMKVRRIAIPGAVVQMAAAVAMGTALAWWWGWSVASGMMLGLALSVASTVVLLRGLEDVGQLHTDNGRMTVGWLIVEDIAMIFALIMVPLLAGARDAAPAAALADLGRALAKLLIFLALMLLVGRRFLPWLLRLAKDTASRELFTLAIVAIAVGIAFGSGALFGISLALGAFFAGMMIKESDYTHEAEAQSLPFQDIFAVLFFVSVGMLFDPMVLLRRPLEVAAVVGIILVGKSLAAFLIVMLMGHPLRTGFTVSAGLAQIGEFSFILVSMGLAHGLLPTHARDLVVAGALISIALNPTMVRMVPWLLRAAPQVPVLAALARRG